jgi:hypothetical protein
VSAPLTDAQRTLLAERYGPARRTPVALLVVVGLLGAAFLGWVVWAALQQADQEVRWRTTGYSDVTDTSVTVEFDVFKAAGDTVVCTVHALDDRSAVVGRAEVPVAGDRADVHVVYALPVTNRPTTAEVTRCIAAPG